MTIPLIHVLSLLKFSATRPDEGIIYYCEYIPYTYLLLPRDPDKTAVSTAILPINSKPVESVKATIKPGYC